MFDNTNQVPIAPQQPQPIQQDYFFASRPQPDYSNLWGF